MARPIAEQLPKFDTLIYGNYNFGPYSYLAEFREELPPTAAGFATSHGRYTMTVVTYVAINAGAGAVQMDQVMNNLRAVLSTSGLRLQVAGKAVGTFDVTTDVMKGPVPQVVGNESYGGLATKLTWTISWALPVCRQAALAGVMDFAYTVSYRIEEGYTTRTMSGRLVIAQAISRDAAGRIKPAYNVDAYREQVVPPPLPGFERQPYEFQISEDRSTLTFTVVDDEMGLNVPPPGIPKRPDVTYSVRSTDFSIFGKSTPFDFQFAAFAPWVATLRATYLLRKTSNGADAVNAFARLVKNKIDYCKDAASKGPFGNTQAAAIMLNFESEEGNVYGRRTASFSCSWLFATTLVDMLQSSGLWKPVPGNWNQWQASVADQTTNVRGTAGLAFDVSQDFQLSLCSPGAPAPVADAELGGGVIGGGGNDNVLGGSPFPSVTPQRSLIDYRCWWEELRSNGNVLQRPLPQAPLTASSELTGQYNVLTGLPSIGVGTILNALVGGLTVIPQNPPVPPGLVGGVLDNTLAAGAVVQRRATPYREFLLCGRATRVGFAIPRPEAKTITVNGVTVNLVPSGAFGVKDFACRQAGGWKRWADAQIKNVEPVFTAWWQIRYAADGPLPDGPPDQIPNGTLFIGNDASPAT